MVCQAELYLESFLFHSIQIWLLSFNQGDSFTVIFAYVVDFFGCWQKYGQH